MLNANIASKDIKPVTFKRLAKDLKEIEQYPIPGLSICQPDPSDPLTLQANILILNGIYKGIILHMIVRLPVDYPFSAPAMNIAPGTGFNSDYHCRVYDHPTYGGSICVDILAGYHGEFKNPPGWSSSYTLTTVLMQMQVFFADPDRSLPSKDKINELKTKLQKYAFKMPLKDGTVFVHSTANPNPPLDMNLVKSIDFLAPKTTNTETKEQVSQQKEKKEEEKEVETEIKKDAETQEQRELKEKLSCSILKYSLFDDNKEVFGYPLLVTKDKFNRVWVTPYSELVSKTAYLQEADRFSYTRSIYDQVYKTGMGQNYNVWLPIYINKDHFARSKKDILQTLQAMVNGHFQEDTSKFDIRKGAELLFSILNKSMVSLLKGTWLQSVAVVEAYCQFYLLLIHLIRLYPQVLEDINKQVDNMLKSRTNQNKKNLGDMGEFVVKLAMSKYGIFDNSINRTLLAEYSARQVFWVLKDAPKMSTVSRSQAKSWLLTYFDKSKISNQLLAFNMTAAEVFLYDEMIIELESNYGFPKQATLEKFLKNVDWIRNDMKCYEEFFDQIGLYEEFPTQDSVLEFVQEAFAVSSAQKYTSVQLKVVG